MENSLKFGDDQCTVCGKLDNKIGLNLNHTLDVEQEISMVDDDVDENSNIKEP